MRPRGPMRFLVGWGVSKKVIQDKKVLRAEEMAFGEKGYTDK